jgi:hypothetical protein
MMILAAVTNRFITTWQPQDPYERDQFQRELFYLLDLTRREAQAPLLKQMSTALRPIIGI